MFNVYDNKIIEWLLEDNNPAIKYRTQRELLEQPANIAEAKSWIFDKLPENWHETKGLWYRYYVTALAECGLSCVDIRDEYIEKAFNELDTMFDCNCGDFMLLTALVKLGFHEHKSVKTAIENIKNQSLSDGGYLCLHRLHKLKYTPKSCYKVNLHALMFLAECHKKGIDTSFGQPLIDYFLNRDIFYKTTDKSILVLESREGWRTIDTFYPFEVMRVGLQNVVEAFSALGYGNDERLQPAWNMLTSFKNESGKIVLKGTLTKSYLQKERAGKPSKWVTFYMLLAEKYKNKQE